MKLLPLEKDNFYHIFNRGVNKISIFNSNENKNYFLKLMEHHLTEHLEVLCYCLMDNHYQFLVQVKSEGEKASKSLSNFYNAYTKAFNKMYSRSGPLFEGRYKRKKVNDETYLKNLVTYIHLNPQIHGIVTNFQEYEFTSYHQYGKQITNPFGYNDYVLELFDGPKNFSQAHKTALSQFDDQDLQGFENLEGLELKDRFYAYIEQLQDTITSKLEEVDGKAKFQEDIWQRPEGGGGRTRVIENGAVFEKGGVNISAVHGELPQSMQTYFGVEDADFFACGLSLVLHPKNPFVPTVHANWRYFEMYDKAGNIVDQWFGGGQDLTPYYLFEEDAQHFHATCKKACDAHHPNFYSTYKKRCDEYFWNAHRNEARGLGGLFFDYCKATDDMKMDDWYNFVTEVGNSFLEAYVPIVTNRKELKYSQKERDWQEIRRGRYVEFNLVHDKGTLFGLRTNGRIESILMSLPPHVQWHYDHQPEKGSEEEKLLNVLKEPKEWIK